MSRFKGSQSVGALEFEAGTRESDLVTMPAVGSATQGDYINIYNAAGNYVSAFIDIDGDGTAPTGALYAASDEQATLAYTTAVAETYVLTFPATSAATQGDYIMIYNDSDASYAVNLDIDADTTVPTGALYTGSDNQIEVDIVTGGTAAQNATLAFTALNGNVTDVSFTDNSDGTLTVVVDNVGVVTDAVTKKSDDSAAGSITVGTITAGSLATTAIVGGSLLAAVSATDISFVDNGDGTVTATADDIGDSTDASVKSTDDSGAGSILATATDGSAKAGYENYPLASSSPADITIEPSTVS